MKIKQKLETELRGAFDNGVLYSQSNGWECAQMFGSYKPIFALIPHPISELRYLPMRWERTGKWAWLKLLDRHTNDFGPWWQRYYTERYTERQK